MFTGCGNTVSFIQADLSYTQSDIGTISVPPDVQVVGLGEASHGVAQYHQMKADVFKALVKNNGCRTFIIEGDFGGALKVDKYINGGSGSAEEAVAEIGFAIYRTQEMVDLIDWMRSYNETASPEESLHFYGMDVQRFDNNKEYLFSVIEQTHPELGAEYSEVFAQLTDAQRTSLDKTTLNSAKESLSEFIDKLDAVETDIVESLGQPAFDFARECAKTIYACCEVQLSDNYNATRDQYMYEKVEWFLQRSDNSILFINGHNFGRTTTQFDRQIKDRSCRKRRTIFPDIIQQGTSCIQPDSFPFQRRLQFLGICHTIRFPIQTYHFILLQFFQQEVCD